MAKASDNVFPKLIVAEGTTPASPSVGQQKLFVDSADHKLKRVNSSGTVTTVEGGGTTGARTVLIYSSGAYPTRPTGGLCEYVGPTTPTDWIANDTWIKAAL